MFDCCYAAKRTVAQALGEEGLRLRSRRVHSTRSARMSVKLALVVLVLAGLIGYFGTGVVDAVSQMPSLSLPGLVADPSD